MSFLLLYFIILLPQNFYGLECFINIKYDNLRNYCMCIYVYTHCIPSTFLISPITQYLYIILEFYIQAIFQNKVGNVYTFRVHLYSKLIKKPETYYVLNVLVRSCKVFSLVLQTLINLISRKIIGGIHFNYWCKWYNKIWDPLVHFCELVVVLVCLCKREGKRKF